MRGSIDNLSWLLVTASGHSFRSQLPVTTSAQSFWSQLLVTAAGHGCRLQPLVSVLWCPYLAQKCLAAPPQQNTLCNNPKDLVAQALHLAAHMTRGNQATSNGLLAFCKTLLQVWKWPTQLLKGDSCGHECQSCLQPILEGSNKCARCCSTNEA